MRATGLLSLVCAVALLVATATAEAAFPGVPGPIAYPRSVVSELGDAGGIFAHGPRKRDGRIRLTDSTRDATPSYSPNGRRIAFLGAGRYKSVLEVMRADGRGSAKEFDHGGTEAEGYGAYLGAPAWGSR